MNFPIDLDEYEALTLDPAREKLTGAERATLVRNVEICRDAIIFFTAVADAKGLGGHTGGPYDIVPEALIAEGFMRGDDSILPIFFDEAGHRVALQYLLAVLHGELPALKLLQYREAHAKLPGHPERGHTPGVKFSSGRLGHMWPYVNGVAMANPGRKVFLFGSDGSQMEGNDAEAARLAVAQGLDVKLIIDDNDVTISGHPGEYMRGFCLADTLTGHGIPAKSGDGEDLDSLYSRMRRALNEPGPQAVINRRKMAPGVPGIEGTPKGHDVVSVKVAREYLMARGRTEAIAYLDAVVKPSDASVYRGSSSDEGKNRDLFGKAICEILGEMGEAERVDRVRVFDCDLEGSCGLHHIHREFPEVFVSGGVMERGNYSAAAGFGMEPGRQGIFGTFAAFLEMLVSEITMARLNRSRVLAHFSHSGVDWMADNTCHFGINNFFAANGLRAGDDTRLYFPADRHQLRAVVRRIFGDPGQRFLFSTRSGTPDILRQSGELFYDGEYNFEPGRDEIIRDGSAGWVVSYGDTLFRALDAVEGLREQGLSVGLVNKPTLNVVDDQMLERIGKSGFVLVVESQNVDTGLGSRFGSWLLQRGHSPLYDHLGTWREGSGGLWEQMAHQGLDPVSIAARISALAAKAN